MATTRRSYEDENNESYSIVNENVHLRKDSAIIRSSFAIWCRKLVFGNDIIEISASNHGHAEISTFAKLIQQETSLRLPTKERKAKYLLDRKPFLAKDLKVYALAYKPFPAFGYRQQLHYLDEIISLCKSQGTNLILVNMPVSKENIDLLGDKIYRDYLSEIKGRIDASGFTFIDRNTLAKFSSGYFYDSVHLNSIGSKVFLTNLVKDLSVVYKPSVGANQQSPRISAPNIDKDKTLSTVSRPNDTSGSIEENNVIDGLSSWWLAKAYFENASPPDVVVLGGSQLGALFGADAYVFDRLVDITGDHCARVLEEDLYGFLNKHWRVFVGALPEAMVSDQLVISQALFSRQYKPKLVAVTLSPRDFIDSESPVPNSTEAFAFFSKGDKLDHGSTTFRRELLSEKNRLSGYSLGVKDDSYSEGISPLLLGKPFKGICPGQVIIGSADGYAFDDNTEEYRLKYKNPFSSKLSFQMQSLESLLDYLSKQRIKVVVFGLPLTISNRKLLPEKFWFFYNGQISRICKKYDADWIDIDNDVKGFNDKEFMDGVHLNLIGGHRLASTLALYIANKFHWRSFAELLNDEKKLL